MLDRSQYRIICQHEVVTTFVVLGLVHWHSSKINVVSMNIIPVETELYVECLYPMSDDVPAAQLQLIHIR